MSARGDPAGPKPYLPSPDDVGRAAVGNLPRVVAEWVLTVLSLISWITIPVNFISQAAKFAEVVQFYKQTLIFLGGLSTILQAAVDHLRPVVIAWRDLTDPILSWFSLQLPSVPASVFEVLVLLTLAAPPLVQFMVCRHHIVRTAEMFQTALTRNRPPRLFRVTVNQTLTELSTFEFLMGIDFMSRPQVRLLFLKKLSSRQLRSLRNVALTLKFPTSVVESEPLLPRLKAGLVALPRNRLLYTSATWLTYVAGVLVLALMLLNQHFA